MSKLLQIEIVNAIFYKKDEFDFKLNLNFIPTKMKIIKLFKYDVNNNIKDDINLSFIESTNLIENKNYDIINFQPNNTIQIYCNENQKNIYMTITLIIEFSKYIENNIFDPFASFIMPQNNNSFFIPNNIFDNSNIFYKSKIFDINILKTNDKLNVLETPFKNNCLDMSIKNDCLYMPIKDDYLNVINDNIETDLDNDWIDIITKTNYEQKILSSFNFNSIGDIILKTLILCDTDDYMTFLNILIKSVYNNEYIIIKDSINWNELRNESRLIIFDKCFKSIDYTNMLLKQMKKYIIIESKPVKEMTKIKFDTIFINTNNNIELIYEYFFNHLFDTYEQYSDCMLYYKNKIIYDMDELYTYDLNEKLNEFKLESIINGQNILIVSSKNKHIELLNKLIELNNNKINIYNSNNINIFNTLNDDKEIIIFENLNKINYEHYIYNELLYKKSKYNNKLVVSVINNLMDINPIYTFDYIFMFNDELDDFNKIYNLNIIKKEYNCYVFDNNNNILYNYC